MRPRLATPISCSVAFFNGAISTMGAFVRDRLSAASTDMIRHRMIDRAYPHFALGLDTSPLCKTGRKS
jgi:hypothetical protein